MTSPKLKLVDAPMTPQHFKFCLARLGWEDAKLVIEFGEEVDRVLGWQDGSESIPVIVAKYLELRLKLKELSDA